MDTRGLIKEMNPHLFAEPIAPERFIALIIGENVKQESGETKLIFRLKTKPSQEAKEAGVKVQRYFRVMFENVGLTKEVDGITEVRTKKKPYPHNIFANTQPNMFAVIDAFIEKYEAETDKAKKDAILKPFGKTDNGNPRFKLMTAVFWGKHLSINVPPYTPQVRDEDGKNIAFKAVKRDPKTGTYSKESVVMSVIRGWYDEDDLTELEEVASRQFDNNVKPFLVDEVTITTRKGDEITQKTEIKPRTLPEDQVEDSETTE